MVAKIITSGSVEKYFNGQPIVDEKFNVEIDS